MVRTGAVFFLVILIAFVVGFQRSPGGKKKKKVPRQDTTRTIVHPAPTVIDSVTLEKFNTLRRLPVRAFSGGEYLRFEIKYGFVTAAEAVMKVVDTVYNTRRCYKIVFTMTSKPFFDVFYKVRDRYESIMDAEGLFPWRFEQHIREGGFSRDFTAEFDQVHHTATTTGGKYFIPPYVQDMMSALYFSRTLDYSNAKVGDKTHMQNFYKDSTYELDVKFKGRQTVEVDVGKFNCIVIEPLAKEGGLFKSEGRVYIWLTDDELKIPVIVTTKIPIGSVDSELVEYAGIAGPIKAKIPRE